MKWFGIEEEFPPVGAEIIAEMNGCKIAQYLRLKIRDGEGLGHIKRWGFISPEEEKRWSSSDG